MWKENINLTYSQLKPSMYENEVRVKKANKTILILKDYLKSTSKLTLVDIGSSTGIMTNEYAKYFKTVIGVDLDEQAVIYANEKYGAENVRFISSPIEVVELPESSVDVVTCTQIYEHVPSETILLDSIYKPQA